MKSFLIFIFFSFPAIIFAQDTIITNTYVQKVRDYECKITHEAVDKIFVETQCKKLKDLNQIADSVILYNDFWDVIENIIGEKLTEKHHEIIRKNTEMNIVSMNFVERIITFDKDSAYVQTCKYYKNINDAYCWEKKYYFGNSVLVIENQFREQEIWSYQKINNSCYKVSTTNEISTETGYVKKLLPLIKTGKFYTLNKNLDTVFVEEYDKKGKIIDYLPYKNVEISDSVYLFVEEMPVFEGGDIALRLFIAQNMVFPFQYIECDILSTIYIRFVVLKTGEIANLEIIRGTDYFLDLEALKVVSLLPNFTPGKQNGKPVNVYFSLPVHIDLN
ncbi:MAG: energy transducer TonB [Bacteroidales bacterium]|nr:energy transducer TonB [Bacteroidales bacterium]